jgi:tryptophan synthase alpha chain
VTDDGSPGEGRIRAAFDDGPVFVPYLAIGDPDYVSSLAYVEALEQGGADVIELGLPFPNQSPRDPRSNRRSTDRFRPG